MDVSFMNSHFRAEGSKNNYTSNAVAHFWRSGRVEMSDQTNVCTIIEDTLRYSARMEESSINIF
jgi:hypothetical protein